MNKYSAKASKIKFDPEDEEKIIDFVKDNEILYNVENRHYRDTRAKNRLWLILAKELKKDVYSVRKKWKTMRDYFIRSRENKSNSTASANITKRDESLLFLLQKPRLKRKKPTSKLESVIETQLLSHGDSLSDDASYNGVSNVDDPKLYEDESYESNGSSTFLEATPKKEKSDSSEPNETIRELSAYRRKTSGYIESKSDDDVQLFFDSMAATVRRFPRCEIAKMKMKIANLVGEVELRLSQETTEIIFGN